MRKIICPLILVALFFFGALYFSADFFVEKGSRLALDYLVAKGPAHGFDLIRPSFRSSEVLAMDRVAWNAVTANLKLMNTSLIPADREITMSTPKVVLGVESFRDQRFFLAGEGINIFLASGFGKSKTEDGRPAWGRIEEGTMKLFFQLDFLEPWKISSQLSWILENIALLLKEGRCSLDLSLSGVATFSVQGRPYTCRLWTEVEDWQTIIVMDKTDVIVISRGFDLQKPLTIAEVELLSRNPLRAPLLIKLKKYARAISAGKHEKDATVPEDAYRHILWSYLLTREYGEDFAQKVTDAHEEGRTGNTEEERAMDIRNNRIGREYAIKGYSESSLLAMLMNDSEVIVSPGQVIGQRL